MKYIKTFESINFKKYIVATMPTWINCTYIFETLKYDDETYHYSTYWTIDMSNNSLRMEEINIDSKYNNYPTNMLEILYQTDDINIAINELKKIHDLNKNIQKYNL